MKAVKNALGKSGIFHSMDEIINYKSLWPIHTFVEKQVEERIRVFPENVFSLGLDISSSRTGYCVMNHKDLVVSSGVISPSSQMKGNSILISRNIMNTLQSIKTQIESTHSSPICWCTGIEKYLRGFKGPNYQMQFMFYLAEINGIVSYLCYELFGNNSQYTHPSTARSILGVGGKSEHDDPKQRVLHYVQQRVSPNEIQWVKKKGTSDQLADLNYDVCDAYVVARYSLLMKLVEPFLSSLPVELIGSNHLVPQSATSSLDDLQHYPLHPSSKNRSSSVHEDSASDNDECDGEKSSNASSLLIEECRKIYVAKYFNAVVKDGYVSSLDAVPSRLSKKMDNMIYHAIVQAAVTVLDRAKGIPSSYV